MRRLILVSLLLLAVTSKPKCGKPKKDKKEKQIGSVMTEIELPPISEMISEMHNPYMSDGDKEAMKNKVGEIDLLLNSETGEYRIVNGFKKGKHQVDKSYKPEKKPSKKRKCKKPKKKTDKLASSSGNYNGDHSVGIPAGKVNQNSENTGEDHPENILKPKKDENAYVVPDKKSMDNQLEESTLSAMTNSARLKCRHRSSKVLYSIMVYQCVGVSRAVNHIPVGWRDWGFPLVRFFAVVYYYTVYFVFSIFNMFLKRHIVPRPSDPILFRSATELIANLKKKELTSTDIIEAYINRIEEVNSVINAVVQKNFDEAREKAKICDKQLAKLNAMEMDALFDDKPLYGLPFTVKDSLEVKGKIVTVGVLSRKDAICSNNAPVIQRMLDAGSILLGITNIPQLALWIECESPVYGRTNNPYDSRRSPGGSSGGEGAANGAAASLMGIGSDVGGSIRIPSFSCGIFGMINTPGVVPIGGHIPEIKEGSYWETMCRIGPITRFAEDLSLFCSVLGGQRFKDVVKNNPAPPLDQIRIYYAEGVTEDPTYEPISTETMDPLKQVLLHFEKKFDKVGNRISFPEGNRLSEIYMGYLTDPMPQMKDIMKCPSGTLGPIEPRSELWKYIKGSREHSLAGILESLGDSKNMFTEENMRELIPLREKWRERWLELLGPDGVLFYPSLPTVAPFHNEQLFKMQSLIYMGMVNLLGFAAVQIPMGLTKQGIPTGVMAIGAPNSDALLISVAEELSESFGGWQAPGN